LHASYSFLEAAVNNTSGTFPVLIYSSSGVMNANLFLFENLASYGYVVISVGHPHWCVFYYNENGEPIFPDYENNIHYQNMWKEEGSEIVNQTKEKITIAKNTNEKKALLRELNNLMPVEISDVRLWTQDFDFIITELSKLNTREALFQGILDLNKIGIFGYSKGGVAAAHACLSDKKYKAGINLSGFMFGDIEDENIKVPFMNIESEESWCVNCEPINDIIYYSAEDDVYMVQIKGATHGNFTDLSAYKEYITTDFSNLLGSIGGSLFLKIQSVYILHFFNKYLKDSKSNFLSEHSGYYDEVKVKFNITRKDIN
jgi:predicted dienelactone hydrolase